MRMLRELGETLAPPTTEGGGGTQPPADLRRRVLTAAHERRRPRWPVRTRLAWQLGAVGAGAVALAVLLAPNLHRTGEAPPSTQEATDAASVLQLAAQTSAALPAPARDDQFVFIETVEFIRVFRIPHPDRPHQSTLEGPQLKHTWWPADIGNDGYYKLLPPYVGKAAGAGAPKKRPPGRIPTEGPLGFEGTVPLLPTDPDEMLAYLYREDPQDTRDPQATPDQRAFDRLTTTVIPMSHANPAAQAAALRAAQRIGGVHTLARVTDAAGRNGIAVARTENNLRTELIFDPQTYRYLGYNLVATADNEEQGIKTGDVQQSMAVKRTAFVERIKQLP